MCSFYVRGPLALGRRVAACGPPFPQVNAWVRRDLEASHIDTDRFRYHLHMGVFTASRSRTAIFTLQSQSDAERLYSLVHGWYTVCDAERVARGWMFVKVSWWDPDR